MYDHVFIAEKGSLAEAIAKARAAQTGQTYSRSGKDHLVGNDLFLNVSGHYYDNAEPGEYDQAYASWPGTWSTLPILPEQLRRVIRKDQDKKGLDPRAVAGIKAIRDVLSKTKRIVNVGDPAREGQLIVDEVLEELGYDPDGSNVLRLWAPDLTQSKIVDALETMKGNAEYRNLRECALARQWADWYLGMNMTRAYSIKLRETGGEGVISIGRVQTPVVRLVVDRDREIANFKPVDHYGATGIFHHANGSFAAKWVIPKSLLDEDNRLMDRAKAQAVSEKIAGKTGQISTIETSPKSQTPPLPYDLTSLTAECAKRLGMTASRTLEIAQELYLEKKVCSYARSDSAYLPTQMRIDDAPTIIANLTGIQAFSGVAGKADVNLKSPAWNDSKVTDHYGIVPTLGATRSAVEALSSELRAVFDIVAKRFIEQFYPDHRWNATVVKVACEGETFQANGKVVTAHGWKAVNSDVTDEETEEDLKKKETEGADQNLPQMARGDPVQAKSAKIDMSKTRPPQPFTDATLIVAMKEIHRYVTNPEIKRRLREAAGLGAASTRAKIVELMIKRDYVTMDKSKKNRLTSTPVARKLIEVIDTRLSDPGMTAMWEDALDAIAEGKFERSQFLTTVRKEITGLVPIVKNSEFKAAPQKPLPGHGETCKSCGKGQMFTRTIKTKDSPKGERVLACSAYNRDEPAGCRNIIWPPKVPPLPGDGTACPNCKAAGRNGPLTTKSYLPLGERKHVGFLVCTLSKRDDPTSCDYRYRAQSSVPPLQDNGKQCPKCGPGKLVTKAASSDANKGRRFYGCSTATYVNGVKGGCDHFEWGDPPKGGAKSGPGGAKGKTAGTGRTTARAGAGTRSSR